MKAQKYKNSVNEIRDHIIYDIINFLNINNIREIDFKNPWIYNMSSITSDTEVIGRLSSNGKVYIDTGLSKFDYNIDLSKLDKKELYYLLYHCIFNHTNTPIVILNYSPFRYEIEQLLSLENNIDITDYNLNKLLKEFKDNRITMIDLPDIYSKDEVRQILLNNLLN